MNRKSFLFCFTLAFALTLHANNHEVWVMDQSDTTSDGGGTLYIFQGDHLAGADAAAAVPEVIDFGGAVRDLALSQTGTAPRRPHMMFFNQRHSHAIISFVATGHVLFVDAVTRAPLAIIDVGVQAHAAAPSPDERYVVVANQNGKLLQRIRTDYARNEFTLDSAATLDLANGVTPSGAPRQDATLRPDNAPICIGIDRTSRFAFVTLRGGGLFVVDFNATPMAIVGEYDQEHVEGHGCGTVETDGKMYINAGGGGSVHPYGSELYSFPIAAFSLTPNAPNTPLPNHIFSHTGEGPADSHGAALTKNERNLWLADRAANFIVVVDTATDSIINELDLVGPLSEDPAPDLMALSPSGNRAYVTFRGPNPLTGNNPAVNNAKGNTPGLGVLRITEGGRSGSLQTLVPINHIVDDIQRADPHGIAVRRL